MPALGSSASRLKSGFAEGGGSLQTQLFLQAMPHDALQPANFGVQLNPQRVAHPQIVQSFLPLSRLYTGSPVCKINVAFFSNSSLLPLSLVCVRTAVGHTFVLAVGRSGASLQYMFGRLVFKTAVAGW